MAGFGPELPQPSRKPAVPLRGIECFEAPHVVPLEEFDGKIQPKRLKRPGLLALIRAALQSQRIVDDFVGEGAAGELIPMKQSRWQRLAFRREVPEHPDWGAHSIGALRKRAFSTSLQVVLLVILGLIAASRYNGAAQSVETLFQVISWMPVLVRGAVFGGAAMLLYGIGLHRGDVATAWRRPASAVVLAAHFMVGLILLIGTYMAPPLTQLSAHVLSAALSFHMFALALWPVYVWTGFVTILPGRRDIVQTVRARLTAMGCLVFAAYFGWRVFERIGYPSAHVFTEVTMACTSVISGALGHPVNLVVIKPDGTPVYRAGHFSAFIFPGCSGFEGIALTAMLLGAVVALERRHLYWSRALILVAVAAICAFLLNVVRLVVLFYIGDFWSADIAENGFHANFGVVSLMFVCSSFVLLLHRVAGRTGGEDADQWVRPRTSTLARERPDFSFVYPTAAILAASLVFGLVSGQFNWFYPGPIVIGFLVLRWLGLPRAEENWSINPVPLVAGLFAYIAWTHLAPPDARASDAFAETLFAATPAVATIWLVFRMVGSALVIPVTEELAFRAFMIPWLSDGLARFVPHGPRIVLAVLASSIMFGLLHRHVLAGIVAGLVFAMVFIRRRSCRDAILAHGTTNLLLCVDAVGWGNWSYL